jgi:hypothetical protein
MSCDLRAGPQRGIRDSNGKAKMVEPQHATKDRKVDRTLIDAHTKSYICLHTPV